MAITYPLSLPAAFHSAGINITATNVVSVVYAPQTLVEQVYEFPGKRWEATIKLPPMKRRQAEQIIGFLLQLNGQAGTFKLGDTANRLPQGVASGNPVVNGIQIAGSNTLLTRGWTPGINGILLAGDWVQVDGGSTPRLYKNLIDANSDGSGNCALTVWPRLKLPFADGLSIVTENAQGVFLLAGDVPWDIDVAKMYGIQIGALESLNY